MNKRKETSVLTLNLNPNRMFFISDIHGDLDLLKKALLTVKFDKNDVLFILGDIIEKGKDNLAILDYLMYLQTKYQVYILAGNCDEVLRYIIPPVDKENFFSYLAKTKYSIIKEMASILNLDLNKIADVDEVCTLLAEKFKKYYDFVDSFYDLIILNNKYVLVHGGIDDINNIPKYNEGLLKYDNFYEIAKPTPYYRIVGHFPVVNYTTKRPCNNPIIDDYKKVIAIDGGNIVKLSGQLNVLILINDEFSFLYVDHYPKQICKKDIVIPNTRPIHLNSYLDKVYYKGEKIGDFYICYDKNGNKCYSYYTNVRIDSNGFFCYDATNYFMPLKKNDRYSLIVKAFPFSIVKNNGYVGLIDTNLVINDEL